MCLNLNGLGCERVLASCKGFLGWVGGKGILNGRGQARIRFGFFFFSYFFFQKEKGGGCEWVHFLKLS